MPRPWRSDPFATACSARPESVHYTEFWSDLDLADAPITRDSCSNVPHRIQSLLVRGTGMGQLRAGIGAIDVRLIVDAPCVLRVVTRYTFNELFGCDLADPQLSHHHRSMINDTVLRFLRV